MPELAKDTGLTRQTIGNYLNGSRLPDAYNLYLISKALDVSVDYLIGLPSKVRKSAAAAEITGLSLEAVEALALLSGLKEKTIPDTISFMLESLDVEGIYIDSIEASSITDNGIHLTSFESYFHYRTKDNALVKICDYIEGKRSDPIIINFDIQYVEHDGQTSTLSREEISELMKLKREQNIIDSLKELASLKATQNNEPPF